MRPLKACLALILAAFVLTGCLKLEMDVVIDEQDTITGSVTLAIEKVVLATTDKPNERAFADALIGIAALPKGNRTEIYEDAKYYGRKVVFDHMPFAEFNAKDGTGPQFVHSGGLYTFTLNGDTGGMQLGPQAAVMKQILDATEVRISVKFPGRVIERDNLATLDGQTVNWRVKLGSKHQFKAVSEEPAGFPVLLVAGVAGLFGIFVIVGVVLLATRRNRRPRPVADPLLTPAAQPFD